MARVIFIIGLPGSGKTTKVFDLISSGKINKKTWFFVDDPQCISEFDPFVEMNTNIIVTDPHLCDQKHREQAICFFRDRNYEVETIYFENAPEKCMNNIRYRNDGKVISLAGMQSFNYTIPDEVTPLKIWQPIDNET